MARVAYAMAVASEFVKAEIVDIKAFWKFSKRHRVGAIPRTFINYGENFIGVETEAQIVERAVAVQ